MQDPKPCKKLLEMILNVKIKWIDYPVWQKSVEIYDDAKGIRFDVYFIMYGFAL